MPFDLTPHAARKVREIITQKGSDLALRIRIRRGLTGVEWHMVLEPNSPESIRVSGVPVLADGQTQSHLDGLIIDWVQTPQGPGFGVFDRSLMKRDLRLGAD